MPSAIDLPTGLGKTSVIAIWLLARAAGAQIPLRLVYVVDRRAVVDQASDVADHLADLVKVTTDLAAALCIDFEFAGRKYQSLSKLATEIAGTRWNGFLFFGLKKRSAEGAA